MTFYASDGTEMSVADSSTDATGITLAAGAVAYCVLKVVTDVDDTNITGDIQISGQ